MKYPRIFKSMPNLIGGPNSDLHYYSDDKGVSWTYIELTEFNGPSELKVI